MRKTADGYIDFGDPEFKTITSEDIPWKRGTSDIDFVGDCIAMEISKLGIRLLASKCHDILQSICRKIKGKLNYISVFWFIIMSTIYTICDSVSKGMFLQN